jgi:hypothetical protein
MGMCHVCKPFTAAAAAAAMSAQGMPPHSRLLSVSQIVLGLPISGSAA